MRSKRGSRSWNLKSVRLPVSAAYESDSTVRLGSTSKLSKPLSLRYPKIMNICKVSKTRCALPGLTYANATPSGKLPGRGREQELLAGLTAQLVSHTDSLKLLSKMLARIDVYVALAEVAVTHKYVRPQIRYPRTADRRGAASGCRTSRPLYA